MDQAQQLRNVIKKQNQKVIRHTARVITVTSGKGGTKILNKKTAAFYRENLKLVWPDCFGAYKMSAWLNEINFDNDILITNVRHKNIISKAIENVKKANEALNLSMPIDIITIYIKDVLEDLGEITGEVVSEDVINEICKNDTHGGRLFRSANLP